MKNKLIYIFLLAGLNIGRSQTLNNGSLISINNTHLTVNGDILLQPLSTIHNHGTLSLSGNWINNSGGMVFAVDNGTVLMNGADQTITGNSTTSFYNLSLAGSGKVTLLNNVICGGNAGASGVLTLGKNLNLNSRTLTVTNGSNNAITASGGYIVSEDALNLSRVLWNMNENVGEHVIPFASLSGVPVPFIYNLSAGSAGQVSVSTFGTLPDNTPLPVLPNPVTHVRNASGNDNSSNTADRFWHVEVLGNPTAAVTFSYAPSEQAGAGNGSMRAQKWNPVTEGWEVPPPLQTNPGPYSVTVNNISGSGTWAVASSSSPLPVELLYFKANYKGDDVLCRWTTLNEKENDYFTVMRSRDGVLFEEAGRVDGNGTTVLSHDYSFLDKQPFPGITYYQLKQTDFNGDFTLSQIVAVKSEDRQNQITVYPNPGNGLFKINYSEKFQGAKYIVSDAAGRICTTGILEHEGLHRVNLDGLPGMYVLMILTDTETITKRIEVIR